MRFTLPLPTVFLVISSTVVFLVSRIGDLLVYDRTAIASGQFWRLFTGHLVHFTPSHLMWNLLVMVFAGWALKDEKRRQYEAMLCVAAIASGGALFLFQPSLVWYGGISGLASASVAYVCLIELRIDNPARWLWGTILALTVLKILVEITTNHFLFTDTGSADFVVVPLVHLVGVMTAILFRARDWKLWGRVPSYYLIRINHIK